MPRHAPGRIAFCNGSASRLPLWELKSTYERAEAGAGTLPAFSSLVIVAIPIWQGRVSPVLDAATRLLVVTRRRGVNTQRREVLLGPLDPEALARSVAELRVDIVLCAALSEVLQRALREQGVRVHSHLCGEAEAILRAFCCRRLARDEFRMPGCWGQHSHGACCRSRHSERSKHSVQEVKAA